MMLKSPLFDIALRIPIGKVRLNITNALSAGRVYFDSLFRATYAGGRRRHSGRNTFFYTITDARKDVLIIGPE